MADITSWLALGYRITNGELKGSGVDKVRGRRSVNEFCSWADINAVPFPVPAGQRAELLEKYRVTLDGLKTASGELNKDGKSALSWAEELMKRSPNPEPAQVSVTGAVAPPEEDPEMAKNTDDTELEQDDIDAELEEAEEDGAAEEDEEEEVEEEEPAPKRRRPRAGGVPIIVQMPRSAGRQQGRQSRRAEPTGKVSKLLRGEEKVRIFKRDERGKRVMVEDYTLGDIGNMSLQEFVEEVVHPRFRNDDVPFTEYMVFQVDPRTDDVRPPASTIRVEDEDAQPQAASNDPFVTVDRAFSLIDRLNHRQQQEAPKRDPAFAAIRDKAANSGDLNSLLMLTMMERLFSQQPARSHDAELVMKLVDRLDRLEGKTPGAGMGMAPMPSWPAPPPAPPPQSHVADRVMELAVAQMVKPPPSLLDQAKELATVRTVFGGGNDDAAALRAELAQLRAQLAGGKRGDGFTDAVESFEKIVTTVKNIAPQIGAEPTSGVGGLAGFFRGMLTPDVGKAIASAITGAQQAAQQQPAQQPKGPTTTTVGPVSPQATNPPPRDPTKPPNPPPPAVAEAAKQFRAIQTPAAGAEKFADFIVTLVLSGDPYYQSMLEPAMTALQAPEVTVETLKPVRALGMRLLSDLRPEWTKPEFVDAAIAALASKNGMELPKALTDTRSRWTLLYDGTVLMLDTVAKEVAPEVPAPPPATLPPGEYPRAEPTPIPPDRVMRAIELEDPLAEKPKPEPAKLEAPAETPAAEVIQFAEPEKAKPHKRR